MRCADGTERHGFACPACESDIVVDYRWTRWSHELVSVFEKTCACDVSEDTLLLLAAAESESEQY